MEQSLSSVVIKAAVEPDHILKVEHRKGYLLLEIEQPAEFYSSGNPSISSCAAVSHSFQPLLVVPELG